MRSKIEVIEKVLAGFEEGTVHHVFNGDSEDPFAVRPFEENCMAFNKALLSWRTLRNKANAQNATEEIKTEFVKATEKMYVRIIHRQSLGILVTDKNQQFHETIALMEQRIESLKAEVAKYKEHNKILSKQLAQQSPSEESEPSAPKKDFAGFA